ncbi:MAG: hypothetical protein LDL41_18450, partial [Coleofasciculus sp. S288]|nr:hypothetical protein [Coleofasciculus sp. S288]
QPKNSSNSSESAGLSQELWELMKTLSLQTGFLVRRRFLNETLRRVVRLHLYQLYDWLHDLIQQNTNDIKLQNAVGMSLASAYRVNPQLVRGILDYWQKECEKYRPVPVDKEIVTPYEGLLATIARTYGKIKCDQHLTQQEIIEHLDLMYIAEKHPFVCTAIRQSLKEQGKEDEVECENLANLYSTNDISPQPIPTDSDSQGLYNRSSQGLYISLIVPWLAIALTGVYYIVFKRNYYSKLIQERLYYKRVISGILPEALENNSSNLLENKFQTENPAKIKIISHLLKVSVWLARNPRLVIGTLIFLSAASVLL